ncbi:hypothetical protein HMPREF0490_02466 [Lachnospiraceae bacterium 6_1_37FAA]|nr:hypothetical protein HMPREF0490_02466 [Lachnospiraceae bacterium 6_1_37FAA]
MKREQYYYFVEGEDDRKVVNTLKTDLQWIKPGKVQVFNVIEEELTGSKSNSDYKRDLLRQSNLADKLKKHQFQFEKFWNSSDKVYESICNDSAQIKIKNNLFLKKNVEIGKDKGNEQRIHELYIHCKMQ